MHPAVETAALLLLLLCVCDTEQSGDSTKMETLCNQYPQTACSNGWYRLDEDRCMKFFPIQKTFKKAEDHCYNLDGHLVSIHSEIQKIRVSCLAWNHSHQLKRFWIGAKGHRERFEYTDGSDFDYNNWHYEWSNYFLEKYRCTMSNYKGWGVWGFTSCVNKFMFVCTKRM